MYYELKEDFVHAMDCYIRGGDHSKVSELLIRSAELHPGMGHYYEMEKYYHNQEFLDIAKKMMSSLSEKYTTVDYLQSNGIIKDGMYSRKHGHKSECTSWGDYFYLEALMRMKKSDWKIYW